MKSECEICGGECRGAENARKLHEVLLPVLGVLGEVAADLAVECVQRSDFATVQAWMREGYWSRRFARAVGGCVSVPEGVIREAALRRAAQELVQ